MLGRKRRAVGGQAVQGAVPGGAAPRWLIAKSARYRQAFPSSTHWDYPVQRGSQYSLAMVGPSYRDATPAQRERRRAVQMTGRGLYRGRGGFFGRAIGNLFGMGDLGDKLGDAAWSVGKSFLPQTAQDIGSAVFGVTDKLNAGRGLYKGRGLYAANNLVMDDMAKASNVVPQFNPSDLHSISYSNREYVRDIFAPSSTSVFELQTWSLNPGLPTSFPWLSQLAINFEEYELVQLAYTFKSTIADFAAASGQVGQVIMTTQYNPDSSDYATKDEMMLAEGGMSCKTTQSMIHGIECDPSKIAGSAQKYVRVGHVPPSEDLKNYDLGKTSLAVINAPSTYANQQIGELWVSYTIILRKPKLASGNAYNVRRDLYIAPPATPVSNVIANQATLLSCARNSLGCTVSIPTTNVATPIGAGTDNLTQSVPQQNTAPFSGTNQVTLTLPSDYSGVLRIRMVVQTNDSGTFTQAVVPISLAPATISRFTDIPGMSTILGTREWSHILNTWADQEVAASPRQVDCEIHIRVQPPTNGAPNVIQFGMPGAALGSGTTTFYQWTLEVSQLNSFLNVSDNGKNDRLDLVQTFSSQPAIYI